MVLHPDFYGQVLDFAKQASNTDPFAFQVNPLVRSIGFLESMGFMRRILEDFPTLETSDYKKKKENNRLLKKLIGEYLNDFKAKTR